MSKKPGRKIVPKGAEQYMLRLPPGLRDLVALRAAENGRSMNTEIVEAIEKHLKNADRVTQLWEVFQKHRENIEALDSIGGAVEALEGAVSDLTDGEFSGRLSQNRRFAKWKADEAKRPPITPEQAVIIRSLIKDQTEETKLLALMDASTVEEIRDFERATGALRDRHRNQNSAKGKLIE